MTLRELVAAHPDMFYAQTWYEREAFMDSHVPEAAAVLHAPLRFIPGKNTDVFTYPTSTLCAAFVLDPKAPIWRHWIWTRDMDRHGQRVYVGVGPDERGLELHRHLHLTPRFGIVEWE